MVITAFPATHPAFPKGRAPATPQQGTDSRFQAYEEIVQGKSASTATVLGLRTPTSSQSALAPASTGLLAPAAGAPAAPSLQETLEEIVESTKRSGADPTKPFYYLGGPMTGIAHFNYPLFREITQKLRDTGMNIVSPVELVNKQMIDAAADSLDGNPRSGALAGVSHADILSKDYIVCSFITCVGGIFIDGWQNSTGARGETAVLSSLRKELYEYHEYDGQVVLQTIERDKRLWELGMEDDGGTDE